MGTIQQKGIGQEQVEVNQLFKGRELSRTLQPVKLAQQEPDTVKVIIGRPKSFGFGIAEDSDKLYGMGVEPAIAAPARLKVAPLIKTTNERGGSYRLAPADELPVACFRLKHLAQVLLALASSRPGKGRATQLPKEHESKDEEAPKQSHFPENPMLE